MRFNKFLNESKIVLTPVEKGWEKDFNREGEILLQDDKGNLYRSYHEGKLHHWDKTYFNLYKVEDPTDYFSEKKIKDISNFELDI